MAEYMGPREELEAWVRPQVEAWSHGVCALVKIAKWNPQSFYVGLWILFQLEWKYLQRTFPIVVTLMGPIKEALQETFSPMLFLGGRG